MERNKTEKRMGIGHSWINVQRRAMAWEIEKSTVTVSYYAQLGDQQTLICV
jgi:hypothetical protein